MAGVNAQPGRRPRAAGRGGPAAGGGDRRCRWLLFGGFVALAGANPLDGVLRDVRGAFGTWFSLQNTLQRAAPLMLTALCTALPARLGLIVIGGEGALVLGGLAAVAAAHAAAGWAPPGLVLAAMVVAGFVAGGLWIAAVRRPCARCAG